MRVLHVLDHSLPLHSGYVFRTQGILAELRRAGIETFHVTSAKHIAGEADEETIGEFSFFRTSLPPSQMERLPGVDQLRVISSLRTRLCEIVNEVHPDIIHAHSPCLNGLAAIDIAESNKIPLVYELRASWEDAAVSHGTTREGSIRYRVSKFLETYLLNRAGHVLTICQGLKDDIIQRGIPESRVTVVPNAVDRSLLDSLNSMAVSERKSTEPVVGFFGSFYDYEGLDLLVKAMAELRPLHPTVRLLLLGSGPKEAELKALVESLKLGDCVEFTGRVPHEQVAEYYGKVDVFVFPRKSMRLTDIVTPLKPLESMAAGVLVVASDVGGHRELIDHDRTGLLFPAEELSDLVALLDRVLSTPEDYVQLKRQGKTFVLRERTWPAVAGRYVTLYKSLVS